MSRFNSKAVIGFGSNEDPDDLIRMRNSGAMSNSSGFNNENRRYSAHVSNFSPTEMRGTSKNNHTFGKHNELNSN